LQDGPQSSTIIYVFQPATHHPPGVKLLKLKFIYLSNNLLDLPQLLNLSLGYQTNKNNGCNDGRQHSMKDNLKRRQPQIEDDLQLKTTSNQRLIPIEETSNGRRPQIEDKL
jgi:hypothetical protein